MVCFTCVVYTTAVLSFLFEKHGNPSGQKEMEFILILTACQAPVLTLVTLLFKRTSPTRPKLEDRWVGAADIPKRILNAVKAREAVLLAEGNLRAVTEESSTSRRTLRNLFLKIVTHSQLEHRSQLTDAEERDLLGQLQVLPSLQKQSVCDG